jgi:hypothetical protein
MRFRAERAAFAASWWDIFYLFSIAIADLEGWRMGKGNGGWWTTNTEKRGGIGSVPFTKRESLRGLRRVG